MRVFWASITLAVSTACAPVPSGRDATAVPADPALALLNHTVGGTPFREGYAGEGQQRIHYIEGGSGPTVLFVHGFPSFWYAWADQLAAFHPCRRVIAIDAPGANLSGKPADDAEYRVEALATRLDTLIAELAPDEKITLVGHDWGGALAWSYAEANPDRLDRLAVFSAPPYDLFLDLLATDPEQQAASQYMQRLVALDRTAIEANGVPEMLYRIGYEKQVEGGQLSEAEGALFRNALADPAAIDGGVAWYRANIPAQPFEVREHAWPGPGATTSVPTLLVRGAEDRTFPNLADHAAAHADDLRIVTLDGVGHWTPFEDPDAANEALGRFLGLPDGRCPAAK